MYADRITNSMRRAIDETERRQQVQRAYNEEHGISPATIVKEVRDLTDRLRSQAETVEQRAQTPGQLPAKELSRLIRELERQMKAAADELEFEKAALLRDRVYELRAVLVETEQAELPAWERERRGARLSID